MSAIKDGKKSLATKAPQASPILNDDVFGNALSIPPELKAELAAQGKVGRWLNAKTLANMQGYHPKGWQVYKRDPKLPSGIIDFKSGSDPDGVVRRGDCILGYKTADAADLHRRHLTQKARRGYQVNSDKAAEMRASLGSSGIKAKVLEGYEENE